MIIKHDPPLILVADDVMPTTVMLERVFEYEGYQVKSVYDGITAIQMAQTLIPDLILLDINMPGMNGFEVLTKLREKPQTAGIPTILITAMGDISDVVQGLNLGADDYLRKPFHPQEVLARAQSKMRARKLEESLQRRTHELEALLRANEELSQHLGMDDLLDFILYLVTDMLPCQIAAIYHLSDDHQILDYRIQRKDGMKLGDIFDNAHIVNRILEDNRATLWPGDSPLIEAYQSGIVIPLQYSGDIRGVLLILNDQDYDDNDLRLLRGVGRSATLAIRNAELYDIQADYAMHLQDMVAERTAELESAHQMLIRSEKLASVGRLAASVAHEIKNPLFPIRINLEHMLEDIQSNNMINILDIEKTLESVERIQYIVDRLLGFTGNWQTSKSDFQWVDINTVIQDIVTLNSKFFEQEGITIETNLSPLPLIQGAKFQLEQVFMNLSLNAKDAMPNGGYLSFTSYLNDGQIVVTVEDTGSGIPTDLIDTIFEPFVSTKENGNGLGLFISYGIMQKHNGTIEVVSEPSKGTTFTLRFPVTQTISM